MKLKFLILSLIITNFNFNLYAESLLCSQLKEVVRKSNLHNEFTNILQSADLVILGEIHSAEITNYTPNIYGMFRKANEKNCYFAEVTEDLNILGVINEPTSNPPYKRDYPIELYEIFQNIHQQTGDPIFAVDSDVLTLERFYWYRLTKYFEERDDQMVENINSYLTGPICSRGFYTVGLQHVWQKRDGQNYSSFAEKIKNSDHERKVKIFEPLMIDEIQSLKEEGVTQFYNLDGLNKEDCFKEMPSFVLPMDLVNDILVSGNDTLADYVFYISESNLL